MKKKQFEALCKQLLPELPGFVSKGWLLYIAPVGHVLRGFSCDGSDFDKEQFVVQPFAIPLYVPTTYLYFLFGDRLSDDRGCEIWWNINDPGTATSLLERIQTKGIPFLSEIDSPASLIEAALSLPDWNPYKWETIAYSATMIDLFEQAKSAYSRLANVIDTSVDWQVEVLDRAKRLEQTLDHDPKVAKQLLEEWEQFSAKNLGVA